MIEICIREGCCLIVRDRDSYGSLIEMAALPLTLERKRMSGEVHLSLILKIMREELVGDGFGN